MSRLSDVYAQALAAVKERAEGKAYSPEQLASLCSEQVDTSAVHLRQALADDLAADVITPAVDTVAPLAPVAGGD